MKDGSLYRTVWRWHFYAGLVVLPFILILSVTGAVYLFKPQIDRWEERSYRAVGTHDAVPADRQLAAALAAHPDSSWHHYRLPEQPGDAAMIHLALADGRMRDVFVSPQGKVLGSLDPTARIPEVVSAIHGSLLLGKWGDWLVELAASWTILLILSGLYLWWPRPFAAAGTLWPRLSLRGRPLLKDIHRTIGFWIAGLVLVMLASGLPWAGAWGSAFNLARIELGLVDGPQDWKVGAGNVHARHEHRAMTAGMTHPAQHAGPGLSHYVERAEAERMAFPVLILPPHAPQRFGPPTGDVWTVKSEPQNRPLGREVRFDPASGAEAGRTGFADRHVIDRIVNTGIAWHEGQLFGLANQLLGLATALALIALSVVGVMMWLKRRPPRGLGAPRPAGRASAPGLIALLVAMGLLLPLFGVSLLLLLAVDRIVRRFRLLAAYG